MARVRFRRSVCDPRTDVVLICIAAGNSLDHSDVAVVIGRAPLDLLRVSVEDDSGGFNEIRDRRPAS